MSIQIPSFKYFGRSVTSLDWQDFLFQCRWMGLESFPFIALAALFVASSLVIDCVMELQKFNTQDFTGALIALGLLRELGALVVGLGWCAHVAAIVCNQALLLNYDQRKTFFVSFVFPRCIAALAMSIPLAVYGLTIGFISGALIAPLLGNTSSIDFFESARTAIGYKDVFIYFIKLCLVNSIIGVLSGCYCGTRRNADSVFAAGQAVTLTFIWGFFANMILTYCFYRL